MDLPQKNLNQLFVLRLAKRQVNAAERRPRVVNPTAARGVNFHPRGGGGSPPWGEWAEPERFQKRCPSQLERRGEGPVSSPKV